jgi:predicted MFS family arabinose efflux permease
MYFTSRKALANGIAASGSSIGGIVYPIVFRHLQQSIGFGWATRVLGFISLATISFSVLVMRPRMKPKGQRKLVDFSAFKDVPYMIFCLAMFMAFIGFYTPLYYIQNYAIEKRITGENLGFYLLPILNAASVPGRILPNFFADYVGALNLLVPCALISGTLALAWIAVDSLGGVLVFVILYGFFSGGIVSMPPVAVTSLTKDMRRLGTRLGQCFFFSAFGLLCGTPVSGVILDSPGGWLGVQLFAGLSVLATGGLLIAARVTARGWKFKVKA